MIVPGPAFQRNCVPEANDPSMDAVLTSGFHRGQLATSVSTDQTISGVAAISISPLAVAGAPVSISTTFTL